MLQAIPVIGMKFIIIVVVKVGPVAWPDHVGIFTGRPPIFFFLGAQCLCAPQVSTL